MEILSRDDAELQGKVRYFTGQTCRRGHLAERYTSNGMCVGCLLRSIPRRQKAISAFLPETSFLFGNAAGGQPTAIEAKAALRYMQKQGWHLKALEYLRADAALMAEYDHEPTMAERFK